MIRCLMILYFVCNASLIAGGDRLIDYSQLRYDEDVISAIILFAPVDFESYCSDRNFTPDMVAAQITTQRYHKNSQDSLDRTLLVFYAGYNTGYLRVLRPGVGQNSWIMVSQTDSVFAEAWPLIRCVDIDCDGVNEIILEAFAGANSIRTFGIVKMIDDGTLNILTRSYPGDVIRGRYIDIDSTNNVCPRLIKVLIDGPVKYRPDSVGTYQFDAARQSYRLESVQALRKQER